MFDRLKKLLGVKSASESDVDFILGHINSMGQQYGAIGAEIAEDCVANGLRQGEIVKLSDIESVIAENHPDTATPIGTGFMERMLYYTRSGEVLNMNVEGGDVVFVHKDYKKHFLARINNN